MATLPLKFNAFSAADEVDLTLPTALSLINARNVEPIGYWFHVAAALNTEIESGVFFTKRVSEEEREESAAKEEVVRASGADKKFVKLSEDDLAADWYDVLKLEQGTDSTENDIRAAYRRRCLETHPDKQPDRSDYMFKRVQRAFEILICPSGRRTYDSSRPFDDAIPEEDPNMDEETFFLRYRPVFERNRRWSVDAKIPSLGDADQDIKDVNRFYDAWYRFNSWRDFAHEAKKEDLTQIEESMSREEKRYYQRENQRIIDRLKKAETKRVRTLVERAQKIDPRIRKVREAEIAAKEKAQAERNAEKERIRNEEMKRKMAIADKEKAEKKAAAEKEASLKGKLKQCQVDMLAFFTDKGLLEDVDTNLIKKDVVRPPNISWLYARIYSPEEAEEALLSVINEPIGLLADKTVPAVLAFNELVVMKEQQLGLTRYGESIKRLTPEALVERKAAEAERRKELREKVAAGTA